MISFPPRPAGEVASGPLAYSAAGARAFSKSGGHLLLGLGQVYGSLIMTPEHFALPPSMPGIAFMVLIPADRQFEGIPTKLSL